MSTSVEVEHGHELGLGFKVARARAGVLLLIISDALSVIAIMAGAQYLQALNTENQFKVPGDYAPNFTAGLLIMIGLLLSGIAFYLWDRNASRDGSRGQSAFVLISLVIMLVAAVGETWIGATLAYGIPIQAYESIHFLVTWFTAVHLWLATVIGILLYGRILRGRIAGGHEFVAQVTGWWWYYAVIASILLWLFATYLM